MRKKQPPYAPAGNLKKIHRGSAVGLAGFMRYRSRSQLDGEGALIERLGLGVAALGLVHQGEFVERLSDVGVAGCP